MLTIFALITNDEISPTFILPFLNTEAAQMLLVQEGVMVGSSDVLPEPYFITLPEI